MAIIKTTDFMCITDYLLLNVYWPHKLVTYMWLKQVFSAQTLSPWLICTIIYYIEKNKSIVY